MKRLPASGRAGLALLLALALAGALAPRIVAHDPLAIDLDARLGPPGAGHWLGTDELGRDLLSRLLHATRPALLVAGIATGLSLLVGIPIGAAAGFAGRRIDLVLSRFIEAALSFPSLVLLLLLTALAMGSTMGGPAAGGTLRSVVVVGVAVGIARWGVIARYMRGEVLRLAQSEMAMAARAAGGSSLRIVGRHLIPAGISPVAVSATFGAGTAVIAEASLAFLGMGVQPPEPTWGQMIASAATAGVECWWLLVFPGLMLALLVGGFNLLGEGLRRGRDAR